MFLGKTRSQVEFYWILCQNLPNSCVREPAKLACGPGTMDQRWKSFRWDTYLSAIGLSATDLDLYCQMAQKHILYPQTSPWGWRDRVHTDCTLQSTVVTVWWYSLKFCTVVQNYWSRGSWTSHRQRRIQKLQENVLFSVAERWSLRHRECVFTEEKLTLRIFKAYRKAFNESQF